MPLNLRIGVLVVGSLDWESKAYGGKLTRETEPIRVEWRNTRLNANKRSTYFVRVPIRYGRRSGSRGGSYTMVISPERLSDLGVGKVIRCRHSVDSINDLLVEAQELWRAESKSNSSRISENWGCVAILTNPNFLNHADADERQVLLRDWADIVTREPSYGAFGFSKEDVVAVGNGQVIENGRLRIPWPKYKNGRQLALDLVLLTATNPEIFQKQRRYPTANEIAAAWHSGDHSYYFQYNRLTGIWTADDAEIEECLSGGRS